MNESRDESGCTTGQSCTTLTTVVRERERERILRRSIAMELKERERERTLG